jgi:hypothetical protein
MMLWTLGAAAETLETTLMGSMYFSVPTGSLATLCRTVGFVTKNSGSLVANLTSANIKLLAANVIPTSINTPPLSAIGHSLKKTNTPGVYTLCLTPKNGASWTHLEANVPVTYTLDFLVSGNADADHGFFSVSLINRYTTNSL